MKPPLHTDFPEGTGNDESDLVSAGSGTIEEPYGRAGILAERRIPNHYNRRMLPVENTLSLQEIHALNIWRLRIYIDGSHLSPSVHQWF